MCFGMTLPGRIQYSRWTDSEGQIRYGYKIIAEKANFLAKVKDASKHPRSAARSCSAAPIEDPKNPALAIGQGGDCACSFGILEPTPDREIETSSKPKVELLKWPFASVARNIRYFRETLSLPLRRQIG